MRYTGVTSRGIITPIFRQGDDLVRLVCDSIMKASAEEGFALHDRDVVGVTEAVVARTQGNYATVEQIAADVREKLGGLFSEIDARETPESRIFRAIDRLEAVIQHNEAALSTWIPLEYELNLTHGAAECAAFPPLHALREEALRRSIAKIQAEEEKQ